MAKRKNIHFAFLILLAVSLIRGFAGPALNGSSGLFLTPVSNDLGIGIGQLSIYLSISSIVSFFFLPAAGNLFNKYSVKTLAVTGALLLALSFSALGFMNSIWGWYLLSVPMAVGATLLVNLLGPILVNRWFESYRGLAMGIMMTITSLLGALFQPLLTNWIVGKGWRFTYIVFGAVAFICIFVITFIFLKNKPEDMQLSPYRSQKSFSDEDTDINARNGVTAGYALKSPAFYLLFIFIIVLTGFAVFSQHITTFGLNQGFEMRSIGKVLSISMIGSAIGSLLIGFASDKLGVISTSIGVMVIGILSVIIFLFSGQVYWMFSTAAFLHGLATSSIGVLAPILTSSFFGNKNYEKLYSFIMMGSPLASVLLVPIYGFVYDKLNSYRPVLIFLLAALIVGSICLLFGNKSSRKLLRK